METGRRDGHFLTTFKQNSMTEIKVSPEPFGVWIESKTRSIPVSTDQIPELITELSKYVPIGKVAPSPISELIEYTKMVVLFGVTTRAGYGTMDKEQLAQHIAHLQSVHDGMVGKISIPPPTTTAQDLVKLWEGYCEQTHRPMPFDFFTWLKNHTV